MIQITRLNTRELATPVAKSTNNHPNGHIGNPVGRSKDIPTPSPTEPARINKPVNHSERSSLKLYLEEIGRTLLLKPEQEVQLAERIQKGDKQARDQMIKSNLRRVVKIAHDYKDFGLPLLDLISECNIGLIKVV
jgi:RNA polymerase primary sigma factor